MTGPDQERCEACRTKAIDLVDADRDSHLPYRLCAACYARLLSRSLRPLEYFHLVARHGHERELRDDFYDDHGRACQPQIPLHPDSTLAFPGLPNLRGNLSALVDFAIVKWWYPETVTAYLQAFSEPEILRELDRRLSENPHHLERSLAIVAATLGRAGAQWVRERFQNYTGETPSIFANALAVCLPPPQGFTLMAKRLAQEDAVGLVKNISAWYPFNDAQVLAWIEKHRDKMVNISSEYGSVCAANQFSWPVAEKWLRRGRPLSIIALDALLACGTTPDKIHRSYYLRQQPPHLLDPASEPQMNQVLDDYQRTDPVHRVKQTIAAIKKEWKDILKMP